MNYVVITTYYVVLMTYYIVLMTYYIGLTTSVYYMCSVGYEQIFLYSHIILMEYTYNVKFRYYSCLCLQHPGNPSSFNKLRKHD